MYVKLGEQDQNAIEITYLPAVIKEMQGCIDMHQDVIKLIFGAMSVQETKERQGTVDYVPLF